jgi:asparaginyl-tRNA synthetase
VQIGIGNQDGVGVKRNRISDILAGSRKEGESVTVCGWVRTKRESKAFAFVVIGDGSTQDTLQLVVDVDTQPHSQLGRCTVGAALRATGVVRASQGKGQSIELQAQEIEVLGDSSATDYPLQKKGHTLEFLREISHLRPRSNTFGAVFRVRSALAQGVHDFFRGRGFQWVHTPIITSNDCEGAGEQFTVTTLDLKAPPRTDKGEIDYRRDFFGRHTHLTVSGQLEAEFLAMALGDVYTFGPTFRAENSNTTRHLSEFWMIEPEMAFADLDDDAELAEDFLKAMCATVLEHCPKELDFLEKQYKTISVEEIGRLSEARFQRLDYTDAIKELEAAKVKFEFPVKWGLDLQSEHERYLTDTVFKGPVIVRNYPKDIKAFYMRQNADGRTVAAMDVLAPRIGEIIGGSQREERLDLLVERMRQMEIPLEGMEWYLDLRRYGSAPHAGFGLGFERLVQYLTGMGNIRDVIPCPRAPQTIG